MRNSYFYLKKQSYARVYYSYYSYKYIIIIIPITNTLTLNMNGFDVILLSVIAGNFNEAFLLFLSTNMER